MSKPRPFRIGLDDVRALLKSPELARVDKRIADGLNLPIGRWESAFPLLADLSIAYLSAEELLTILRENEEGIVKFGLGVQDLEHLGGEYPPGEEPDEPEDRGVTLGIMEGAALSFAIEYHFLKNGDDKGLLEYLKASRMPHAKKVLKQFQELYNKIRSTA